MTCIIGLITRDEVLMGADSLSTRDDTILTTQAYPKVRRIALPHDESMLVGCCGIPRLGQLLEYGVSYPAHEADDNAMTYLCRDLIPAIQKCFQEQGFLQLYDGREYGGWFLIAYAGELYHISPDFSIVIPSNGMIAIGSGARVAEGAMLALEALQPQPRIVRALEIAAELDPYVAGPFVVAAMPRQHRLSQAA